MHGFLLNRCAPLIGLALAACSPIAPPPQAETVIPGATARQIVRERLSAVVVTGNREIGSWVRGKFSMKNAPQDADGGSAAPITPDGYFLTADHVLAHAPGKNVFIIYGRGGSIITRKARIVWRSASDDLAILHITEKTPYFYHWTPPQKWLSPGHGVIHGGMATGFSSSPGKLRTGLAPEGTFTGNRPFKIDIPLKPGDSGGPIVDAYGNLVGINSAVEFLIPLETAIFIDSEGNRPNTGKIASIIARDRRNNP
ncbi:MAG: serine protease [Akkermansiaceae bacterium]|nr:serine protease [Akkermansiaceae bacterium]MDP4719799.1 serine protease [Akkermansiaceae bacterium]MDP4781003.1 serine protease [Akkermansiaceae bacterium]MDP4898772.1 serine protease [Akkermansiaceae bacterium]MDP4996630.1 serine protease [Akkermansiaceae bacterium]